MARPLNGGVRLQKLASPHFYYHGQFGFSRLNHTSVIMDIRQKNMTPRVPLLCKLTRLKVIATSG